MDFKDYQQRVLDTLDAYLDELTKQRDRAERIEKLAKEQPDLGVPVPDFPSEAWKKVKAQGKLPLARQAYHYSPRTDGAGHTVPNICLKVPTGGGKTLLATAAVSRVFGSYLSSNTGFVLWIVPNEAIYSQTRKQLTNREHPYRQMLDKTAAGRVKFLEKDGRLDRRDVESHLCVMLLMLQSANRETKETLRIFRDRGNVHGFFPVADDVDAHFELLQAIPNLSAYADQNRNNLGSIVQDSLGNALRYIRPVVVMDEGHKAYSIKALETLYGFNPCFLLELSATPKDRTKDHPPRWANWLVDVRGTELAKEEMVKLPINLKVKGGDDWKDCLRDALDLLDRLQTSADALIANTDRYIRPMMLVQVERTGKDQRESGHIHAQDAKDFLLFAGLAEREIAIKSAEVNDLEDRDLLSPTCSIRVIITKQALQEGWDCPFAYVLCSLAANHNMRAMTQLVGRILRQPHAQRTQVQPLDECYVVCHHAQTSVVVEGIKTGLEEDGMGDLVENIREDQPGNAGAMTQRRKVVRRKEFTNLEIFLPMVNWVDGQRVRPLDYDQDLLLNLDWSGLDMAALANSIPKDAHLTQTQMTRITVGEGVSPFLTAPTVELLEASRLDPLYATRIICDIVPNPWIGRELVAAYLSRLQTRGFSPEQLGAMSGLLLEELRKFLLENRERLAEDQFIADVASERIQFRLRTDQHNWRMPAALESALPEQSPQLPKPSGNLTEKSLFSPVYTDEYNSDEREFACYLDEEKALVWWHRNVAKAGQYGLQGWRKHKVYPDFIFAVTRQEGDGQGKASKLVCIETKGDQLEGNLDTDYKRKLMELATAHYRQDETVKAGELELVADNGVRVVCDMLLMSEWKTKVHAHFK
jgi:type III restriction enzyme